MHLRSTMLGLLGLPLIACGPSEKKFKDDYVELYCAAYMECSDDEEFLSFGDESDCRIFMSALFLFMDNEKEGCEYNRKNAKECLNDLEQKDCQSFEEGGQPGACEGVYEGDCDWSSLDTGS